MEDHAKILKDRAEHPDWSQRQISENNGCSRATVNRILNSHGKPKPKRKPRSKPKPKPKISVKQKVKQARVNEARKVAEEFAKAEIIEKKAKIDFSTRALKAARSTITMLDRIECSLKSFIKKDGGGVNLNRADEYLKLLNAISGGKSKIITAGLAALRANDNNAIDNIVGESIDELDRIREEVENGRQLALDVLKNKDDNVNNDHKIN